MKSCWFGATGFNNRSVAVRILHAVRSYLSASLEGTSWVGYSIFLEDTSLVIKLDEGRCTMVCMWWNSCLFQSHPIQRRVHCTQHHAILYFPSLGPVSIRHHERNGLGWSCGLAIAGGQPSINLLCYSWKKSKALIHNHLHFAYILYLIVWSNAYILLYFNVSILIQG